MKFKDFLNENTQELFEAPLPNDFDKTKFRTFKEVIEYATEKVKKIGTGSSRVAFEFEYKGRPTILKIAKNKKGLAQNEEEVNIYNDGYLGESSVIIPCIDWDEEHGNTIHWIHTEKAEKIKDSDFVKVCGVGLNELIEHMGYVIKGGRRWRKSEKIDDESEFVSDLHDFLANSDVELGDLTRLANWGLYKGNPVIIDIGLTPNTIDLYRRR